MVVLYQSTKSSIQAIQEDSAQRYVDTVRDRLSAYFDKWKVTVDALSKIPEVKSKDWSKLKPILNAISTKYDEVRAFAMSNADGSYWYEPIPGNPARIGLLQKMTPIQRQSQSISVTSRGTNQLWWTIPKT